MIYIYFGGYDMYLFIILNLNQIPTFYYHPNHFTILKFVTVLHTPTPAITKILMIYLSFYSISNKGPKQGSILKYRV
jgi:hypothetical protein